ncbi:OmpL47-type beta-barrel domain-containing protein [Pseudoneobacillus sp. C159]
MQNKLSLLRCMSGHLKKVVVSSCFLFVLLIYAIANGILAANDVSIDGSETSNPFYQSGDGAVVIDSTITISGIESLSSAKVQITNHFRGSEDELIFKNQNGISGNYDSGKGILSLSGIATVEKYETALRSVRYNNKNTSKTINSNPRTFLFSVGGNTHYNSDTGHFYEYVSARGISWQDAKASAESKSLYGVQGYLATITSAQENQFITSILSGLGWIGASDAEVEGEWKWVTGPESGTLFTKVDRSCYYNGFFWTCHNTKTTHTGYQNWEVFWPGVSGGDDEDYGYLPPWGGWNALHNQNGSIQGYVVEYGGMSGDSQIKLTHVATMAIIPDKVAPTATVAYSKVDPTNQNVVATITPSETVTITNNGGSSSYTFVENGSFTFEFVDKAGNVGSVEATVTNIDKVAPTATIAYSNVDPTNQDVVATITPSEEVTITNNDGSTSYTFVENGNFTFEFVDKAGNIGSVEATVTNIDKVAPTATVAYSKVNPTNQNVVATITPSEEVTITNNGGSTSYTFVENGSFTFEFVDKAGNVGSVDATVTNIDKVAPTATIAYSKVDPTNQDVVATITPSEEVTITNNGGSTSYTFVENGSFTFEFVDKAGNVGSVDATVTNIDKVAPTATIAYSKVDPTNKDVVASLTPSEEVTITNNGGSTSYTFVENGNFTFEFVDKAGNIGSVEATVSNIDKVAPTATIAYSKVDPTNKDVVASLTPSEEVTITNNGGSTSYTFVENGSFTFEFVDKAGNVGSVEATVTNIDKVVPTSTVVYSNVNPTNQDVVATITPSEEVTITNNDGSTSYTFVENGNFTFEFVDKAGNIGSVEATVSNIDKVAPTATIAYSKVNPTNQNVVATITPSEEVTITNNDGSTSYTFVENGNFTFEFVDKAGNIGSVEATVSNIDKVAPTATIAYSKVDPTNKDVVASLTPSEEVTITNNGGSTSYTFVENGSFTFEFVDKAGNVGSVDATVTNIDKVAPTATIAYSKVDPTNQDVVATITPSEEVTITNNDGSTSYTFVENGNFTFEFVDKAGNIGSVEATVTNIDKVAPTATIAYSKVDPTNQDVVATITPSEEVTITNNGGSTSYTFVENGSFTFEFVDKAGNRGTAVAGVSNIDKIVPVTKDNAPQGWVNSEVTFTLTASDNQSGIDKTYYIIDGEDQREGDTVSIGTEGKHTVTYWSVDKAGNVEERQTTTIRIDKSSPILNVVLDTPVLWSPNHKLVTIKATVTVNDSMSGVDSIVLTSITSNEADSGLDKDDLPNDIQDADYGTFDTVFMLRSERAGKGTGRIYTVTYTATDKAGNQTTVSVTVEVPHDKGKK